MNHMFYNCSQLTNLDLSIINTTKATNFEYMFDENYNLNLINISSFSIDDIAFYEGMFEGCDKNLVLVVSSETFKSKELLEFIENNFTVEYI